MCRRLKNKLGYCCMAQINFVSLQLEVVNKHFVNISNFYKKDFTDCFLLGQ